MAKWCIDRLDSEQDPEDEELYEQFQYIIDECTEKLPNEDRDRTEYMKTQPDQFENIYQISEEQQKMIDETSNLMEEMMAEVNEGLEEAGVDVPKMLREENEKRQQEAAEYFAKGATFVSQLEELD